jgi:hypothetical protein
MRKKTFLAVLLLFFSISAAAQYTPQAEVFGGYSLLHTDPALFKSNANGFEGAFTYNFNRWVGGTADFSGHFAKVFTVPVHDYNLLFGPTVEAHFAHVRPFVHGLVGDSHISIAGVGKNSFAEAAGGGVDLSLNPGFSVRLIQADYLHTHWVKPGQNNARISFGVVFKFNEE